LLQHTATHCNTLQHTATHCTVCISFHTAQCLKKSPISIGLFCKRVFAGSLLIGGISFHTAQHLKERVLFFKNMPLFHTAQCLQKEPYENRALLQKSPMKIEHLISYGAMSGKTKSYLVKNRTLKNKSPIASKVGLYFARRNACKKSPTLFLLQKSSSKGVLCFLLQKSPIGLICGRKHRTLLQKETSQFRETPNWCHFIEQRKECTCVCFFFVLVSSHRPLSARSSIREVYGGLLTNTGLFCKRAL